MVHSVGYDSIGWSARYSTLLSADTSKEVMEYAAHTLLLLLDYGHSISHLRELVDADHAGSMVNMVGYNVYRHLLTSHPWGRDDLEYMGIGFTRLLTSINQHAVALYASSTAGSVFSSLTSTAAAYHPVPCDQQIYLLLWRFLLECPAFLDQLVEYDWENLLNITVVVLNTMLVYRSTDMKRNLVHLCTFILLRLSAERGVAVLLNKPYNTGAEFSGGVRVVEGELPLFYGSYADAVILVCHRVLTSSDINLDAMRHCLLTVISNISPYCKSLSNVTAMKLVSLFERYSSVRYLTSQELHHTHVALLLETLNNLIQYQYDGNAHVVYAILRSDVVFHRLHRLSYEDVMVEGHRLRMQKELSPAAEEEEEEQGEEEEDGEEEEEEEESGAEEDSVAPTAGESEPSLEAAPAAPSAAWQYYVSYEWFQQMKADLPLHTVMKLLGSLIPMINAHIQRERGVAPTAPSQGTEVQQLYRQLHGTLTEIQILEFIRSNTLVGLLPQPHRILVRHYVPTAAINTWYSSYMHSVLYVRIQESEYPLFNSELAQDAGTEEGEGAVGTGAGSPASPVSGTENTRPSKPTDLELKMKSLEMQRA